MVVFAGRRSEERLPFFCARMASCQPFDGQGCPRAATHQDGRPGQDSGVHLKGDSGVGGQSDLDLIGAMVDPVLLEPLMTSRVPISRDKVVFTW